MASREFCSSFLCICILCCAEAWLFRTERKTVCHAPFGCYSNAPPFNNANGHVPQAPYEVNVSFWLNTRRNPTTPDDIRVSANMNHFQARLPTKFIIHGYTESRHAPWISQMVRELLLKEEQNVFVVDWSRGADSLHDYMISAANCRLVGAIVADFITTHGVNPSSTHIIGHSLGAHIAGYIGARTPGLDRISGLDPAGPAFGRTDVTVRLDSTDADFVDVIHTNGMALFYFGFGTRIEMGTVDFYPNGGQVQPGCPQSVNDFVSGLFQQRVQSVAGFVDTLSCNHLRSVELYTESINSDCQFMAYPCPPGNVCDSCGVHGCIIMGYEVDRSRRGTFFVPTNSQRPFCQSG